MANELTIKEIPFAGALALGLVLCSSFADPVQAAVSPVSYDTPRGGKYSKIDMEFSSEYCNIIARTENPARPMVSDTCLNGTLAAISIGRKFEAAPEVPTLVETSASFMLGLEDVAGAQPKERQSELLINGYYAVSMVLISNEINKVGN